MAGFGTAFCPPFLPLLDPAFLLAFGSTALLTRFLATLCSAFLAGFLATFGSATFLLARLLAAFLPLLDTAFLLAGFAALLGLLATFGAALFLPRLLTPFGLTFLLASLALLLCPALLLAGLTALFGLATLLGALGLTLLLLALRTTFLLLRFAALLSLLAFGRTRLATLLGLLALFFARLLTLLRPPIFLSCLLALLALRATLLLPAIGGTAIFTGLRTAILSRFAPPFLRLGAALGAIGLTTLLGGLAALFARLLAVLPLLHLDRRRHAGPDGGERHGNGHAGDGSDKNGSGHDMTSLQSTDTQPALWRSATERVLNAAFIWRFAKPLDAWPARR
ncbi:hypothetical protein [Sphingomicrobium sediminis]|uniref:Uncharacterized protein n=1 Tax=Sphingomicrobium sediminis TaxID=2950949 RepID=A0A9X2EEZ4_9SPHN|nr:hypothetical protein [Sphingomicrobium sediminis]MCM8556738.1 hypothetical protein [Sphingomicrobium sediminis]